MRREIIALIIQEGGRFCSELIRNRHRKQAVVEYPPTTVAEEPFETAVKEEEKAGEIATACVPCAIGHYGTCSGLLNESVRFAKKEGMGSSEVIDRVNMCLDELNVMERVDLRSELTIDLPPWEKELADKALMESRNTRHALEALTNANDLERATAKLQTTRNEIGREWFKKKLAKMPKEEKTKLAEKAIEKLGEEE